MCDVFLRNYKFRKACNNTLLLLLIDTAVETKMPCPSFAH